MSNVRTILASLALLGALAASSAKAEETTISIDNFSFSPAKIRVKAGTKVVFVNRDDIPHTVVLGEGKIRSKALDTEESFAYVFDKEGDFIYFCGLHPHMKGEIDVALR
jgi:plastocyanin